MSNIIIIFLAVFIDQLTKFFIVSNYNNFIFSKDVIPNFLRFTYITNDGIAFGLNPFGGSGFILLFVSIIAVLSYKLTTTCGGRNFAPLGLSFD